MGSSRIIWLSVLALAACGGPVRKGKPERLPKVPRSDEPAAVPGPLAATPEPIPVVDWSVGDSADADFQALWRTLEIDGTNWMERVDSIPSHLRGPMASALLREGGFECRTVSVSEECASREYFLAPASTADLADPCLRREIAMWAIDQIPEDDLDTVMFDAVVAVAALPAPETELNQRAMNRLAAGSWIAENALWEATAAGNDAFVEANIDKLDPAKLPVAASEYHIDSALLALAVADHAVAYLHALDDFEMRHDTRVVAAHRLVDWLQNERVKNGERELADDEIRGFASRWGRSCDVAGVAARALEDPDWAARQVPIDEQELVELVCKTLHSIGPRGKPWKKLINRDGMDVTYHYVDPFRVDALWADNPYAYDHDLDGAPDVPEADADGDGDPATWTKVERRRWYGLPALPFIDELMLALPNCRDMECPVPGTTVWFKLEVNRSLLGTPSLQAIHRYEHLGADC